MQLVTQPRIEEVFACQAGAGLLEFKKRFQALYRKSPIRAVKFFFHYLDTHGIDQMSLAMALWATSGNMYVSLMLAPDPLYPDRLLVRPTVRTLSLLREIDPQFLFKFATSLAALTDPQAILRGLSLAPALGDYSILISWLRTLSQNGDERVRSCATKLLCQLRPSKGLIERHVHSSDARVRAGVIEALWNPETVRPDLDVFALLRSALTDPHHRVVANAMVGLYRLGEVEVVQFMFSLSAHDRHLVRAATAWAMGETRDQRTVPSLLQLTLDRWFIVRERASLSLSAVGHPAPHRNANNQNRNLPAPFRIL